MSARTTVFEPGIHIVETVEFPCQKPHDIQHEFILRLEYPHFRCSQLLCWIEIWSSERMVATDPHCEEVVGQGGHPKLGPLCLAHLPPLQPPK